MSKRIRDISWDDYFNIINLLAIGIQVQSPNQYDYIYGIPRGGLIPSVIMSHLTDIPVITHLEYDVLAHNKILIVDDIIDTGETIKKYTKLAMIFDTLSLYWKEDAPFRPKYWVQEGRVQADEWIVFPYEIGTNDPISKVTYKRRSS